MSPTRAELVAILRDVREGRRDRAEVAAWAKGAEGDLGWTLEALTLPRSGHSSAAPGREGDWFLDAAELDDWMILLEGRSEARPLEPGWQVLLGEPWLPQRPARIGYFYERPRGLLLRELGRPQRGPDDWGNEFRVSRHLSRVAAERVEREYSARGHKQDYWVQPA